MIYCLNKGETMDHYYSWDEESKKLQGRQERQIDPLETQIAGHTVYCGLPQNATFEEPPEEQEGYDIVWAEDHWEYQEKKKDPEPEPYVPTEEDKRQNVRSYRNYLLQSTDFSQLDDVPLDEDEKAMYREYRQYLRDYTNGEEWWESNPQTYDEWLVTHHPVG